VKVAVVIPTIEGREPHLERCVAAYKATAPDAKLYVQTGHPTCGEAWNAGAKRAKRWKPDYLHLTADDLEPQPGWLDAAVEAADRRRIPAPLVFHPDGTLESAGLIGFGCYTGPYEDWTAVDYTTVPFVTWALWGQIGMPGELHYCTDMWVSAVGRHHGWETAIRTPMRFTHHSAAEGRIQGRAPNDARRYTELLVEKTAVPA
jgi:hypothetical protein